MYYRIKNYQQPKEQEIFTIIDEEDLEKIQNHSWYLNRGYVEAKIKGKTVSLHRYLTNPPPNLVVDHLNGNKLDNRRENLQITTRQGNSWNRQRNKNNSTGFRGVSKLNTSFYAQMKLDGKNYYLGRYENEKEAAEVVELLHHLRLQSRNNY